MPDHLGQHPAALAAQYGSSEALRVRIETHRRYTVGPELEPAVDAALALRGHEDLLDVGTGPGGFPARLRALGHLGRIVGVDASPGMVREALAQRSGVSFACADAQRLPFADATFDAVTARHMLYHVPDPRSAIREAQRVLRDGGRFLAVTNARGYMGEYRDLIAEAADSAGVHAADLRERLLQNGSSAFDERAGAELIADVFGRVEVTLLDSALVFDRTEPVLAYFDSTHSLRGVDDRVWDRVRASLASLLGRRLSGGPWRVSKRAALLWATKTGGIRR